MPQPIQQAWDETLHFINLLVSPDWGSLVALIPLALTAVVILYFGWLVVRLATLPPTRTGRRRLAPTPPPGTHLPGGSISPLLISAGAALLLLGIVFRGPLLPIGAVALVLAGFGLGFGLTVTPRSTAAVESAGRASFGMASAIVTVARMVGMAVGVSILTAYGSTRINDLYDSLFSAANPDGWRAVVPPELRNRDLHDGFVVDALERWASNEASSILVGIFLVAGVVTIVAIPASLALGGRTRRLTAGPSAGDTVTADGGGDGTDGVDGLEGTLAL
ncbi:MAG TPA: hypothetical protein VFP22_07700 [Candidatus Limnocylindrales bacterium]|nr:hypothetical protein [Candidatus Limnocylindrales bacterium]